MNYNEYVTYILLLYGVFLVFVFYFLVLKNRGKIKVRVKTPLGERVKFCKVEDDGKTIIVNKGSNRKKIPEWKFTFTHKSLFQTKYLFGLRERKTLEVFYHASKAVEYDYSQSSRDTPLFDKKTSKEFIEMEAFRKRGELPKLPLPPLFWLMFAVNLLTLASILYLVTELGLI